MPDPNVQKSVHPVIDVIGQPVVLATNELVAVERKLGGAVANAAVDASAIVAAVDRPISGD